MPLQQKLQSWWSAALSSSSSAVAPTQDALSSVKLKQGAKPKTGLSSSPPSTATGKAPTRPKQQTAGQSTSCSASASAAADAVSALLALTSTIGPTGLCPEQPRGERPAAGANNHPHSCQSSIGSATAATAATTDTGGGSSACARTTAASKRDEEAPVVVGGGPSALHRCSTAEKAGECDAKNSGSKEEEEGEEDERRRPTASASNDGTKAPLEHPTLRPRRDEGEEERVDHSKEEEEDRGREAGEEPSQPLFRAGTRLKKYSDEVGSFVEGTIVRVQSCSDKECDQSSKRRRRYTYSVEYAKPKSETSANGDSSAGTVQTTTEENVTESDIEHMVKLHNVKIGSRVSILWTDDNNYYEATVAKYAENRPSNPRACYYVYYDFGRREWIDLSRTYFRIMSTADAAAETTNAETPSSEDENATLTKSRVEIQEPPKSAVAVSASDRNEPVATTSAGAAPSTPSGTRRSVAVDATGAVAPKSTQLVDSFASPASPRRTVSVSRLNTMISIPAVPPTPPTHKSVAAAAAAAVVCPKSPGGAVGGSSSTAGFAAGGKNNAAALDAIVVGSRISFYWPEDKAFYQANVVRMRLLDHCGGEDCGIASGCCVRNTNEYFLEFDDGVCDWVDLTGLQCRIISADAETGVFSLDGEDEEEEEQEEDGAWKERDVVKETDSSLVDGSVGKAKECAENVVDDCNASVEEKKIEHSPPPPQTTEEQVRRVSATDDERDEHESDAGAKPRTDGNCRETEAEAETKTEIANQVPEKPLSSKVVEDAIPTATSSSCADNTRKQPLVADGPAKEKPDTGKGIEAVSCSAMKHEAAIGDSFNHVGEPSDVERVVTIGVKIQDPTASPLSHESDNDESSFGSDSSDDVGLFKRQQRRAKTRAFKRKVRESDDFSYGSDSSLDHRPKLRRGRSKIAKVEATKTPNSKGTKDKNEARHSKPQKVPEPSPDISLVTVGSRIGVWWPDDYRYYKGKVVNHSKASRLPWHIEYDDGEEEWIDLTQHAFKFLPGSIQSKGDNKVNTVESSNASTTKTTNVSDAKPSKVKNERPEYKGGRTGLSVQKIHPKTGKVLNTFSSIRKAVMSVGVSRREMDAALQPGSIETCAGYRWRFLDESFAGPDQPTEGPVNTEVKPKDDPTSKVCVGTRLGVWWEDDGTYYNATVERYKDTRSKPWKLLYDDNESEWLDLRKHKFRILADGISDHGKRKNGKIDGGRKRKSRKDDAQMELARTLHTGYNVEMVKVGTRVSIWWGGDKKFFDATVSAIHWHSCQFFIEYDDGEEEWLDLNKEKFIILENERKYKKKLDSSSDKKEGLFDSDDDTTETEDEGEPQGKRTKHSFPVLQVHPKSGKVVKEFSSVSLAVQNAGVSRKKLERVLNSKTEEEVNGFYWQFADEKTTKKSPQSTHSRSIAVQQCCLKTGDVLNEYDSVADACRLVGGSSSHIVSVCDGKSSSAAGYFWRWKGSDSVPNDIKGMVKIVQVRKLLEGKPHREFWSVEEAALWIGSDVEHVSKWCREEKAAKLWYWRYEIRMPRKEEEHVGKRLKMYLRPENLEADSSEDENDYWEDGIVESYNPRTRNYTARLDNGETEPFVLKDHRVKFRDENGMEPVQQLCLASGEILNSFPNVPAAAKAVKADKDRIMLVLRGVALSASGFFWRYSDSDKLPFKKKTGRGKSVEQVSLDTGEVMASFPSLVAAELELGLSRKEITACCTGSSDISPCGTYRLRYQDAKDYF